MGRKGNFTPGKEYQGLESGKVQVMSSSLWSVGITGGATEISLFINLLICFYFWLCWVFVAVCGFSLVVPHRLFIAVASLVVEHRL